MDNNIIHKLIIREASQEDVDIILTIWEKADLTYKPKGRDTTENLLAQLKLPQIRIFIGSIHNEDIATIITTHDGRRGWLNRLAVLKKHRNRGIAQQLITYSEQWLASQGIQIYAALIDDPNDPSMNLFKKAGYVRHDDIIYYTKKIHPEV
ncbi:MAG: GNAT family N-acetyltransferase [Candidatus Cloacimonetes bacterium]|nr:GNAT family N-acetyltransferase [Candidatus Cloacimonadota bacterium]